MQRAAREIEYPAVKWQGPSGPLDHDERWTHARRLLHDRSLKPEDRVAGLLLLLYAQWPAAISRLTVTDIDADGGQVRLRLGQTPITLPEPLASLTTSLVATRHGHAVLGDQGTRPGCSPAASPAGPSAATGWPSACAASGSALPRPAPPPVPARHRAARRRPGPHARHPHRRRRPMAARFQRRLDPLRRRRQPQKRAGFMTASPDPGSPPVRQDRIAAPQEALAMTLISQPGSDYQVASISLDAGTPAT